MRPIPSSRSRRRAAVSAAALALAAVPVQAMAASAPREAAPRTGAASPVVALAPPSPDLPGLPPMSVALARVPVDSKAFREARDRYDVVATALSDAQTLRIELDRTLTAARIQRERLTAGIAAARARIAAVSSHLDKVNGAIADLGVNLFVSGGTSARIDAALADEQPSINVQDRQEVLATATLDVLLGERRAYKAKLDKATARLDQLEGSWRELESIEKDLAKARPKASAAEVKAAPAVAGERVAYELARVLATVEGVEFPLVALDAYYRASTTLAEDQPRCAVQWWAIAGISRVEGRHGTYGGSRLTETGDTTKRIIGIQLNGSNQTRVVQDTDDGAIDGDATYDRAVGPMQFIPQTWRRFSSDGNGDLVESPFNLYDATLAAGRYLCRASSGLDAEGGLRAAYFSYNHSLAYVENVLGHARFYERAIDVPPPRAAAD